MTDQNWLAEQFEDHRDHLRAVAQRMLGSTAEADDAVQKTWLRVSRAGTEGVDNLGGWLTTVVGRISLDMLRTRGTRREEPLGEANQLHSSGPGTKPGPEDNAVLADSVGSALLVVLDTLSPAERLAFVLYDMFGVSFDEIASIIGRSPAAARQLASRARRRVRGADSSPQDVAHQRAVVDAFLAASRGGDFSALLDVLDPDIVVRADAAATAMGADAEVHGADAVARTFAGRAQGAAPALIDGDAGLVWAVRGVAKVVFDLTIEDNRIVEIAMIADTTEIERLQLEMVS
jgi:RNA polymerase sigma factor (sigma-70 family)